MENRWVMKESKIQKISLLMIKLKVKADWKFINSFHLSQHSSINNAYTVTWSNKKLNKLFSPFSTSVDSLDAAAWRINNQNECSIHSPFVQDFCNCILLHSRAHFYDWVKVNIEDFIAQNMKIELNFTTCATLLTNCG